MHGILAVSVACTVYIVTQFITVHTLFEQRAPGLSDCLFTIYQPNGNALKIRLIKEGKSHEEVKQLSHSCIRDRYQQ